MKLPLAVRSVLIGLVVALAAANVGPVFLFTLGAPLAAVAEALFLGFYLWWASGGGPPPTTRQSRAAWFRGVRLTPAQWLWGAVAAICFAVTVHASIVLLFRLTPFPEASFRQGYDFSFIPTAPQRWLAVVMSAASAGICEETGFRGYMQVPIEERYGPKAAILTSAAFFTLLHLSKGWALLGMVPIVFGAGIMLGLIAWASKSLVPCMIGHVVMDIGLFAFWWTGIAGNFTSRPISETGVDQPFLIACAVLAISVVGVTFSVRRTISIRRQNGPGRRRMFAGQS